MRARVSTLTITAPPAVLADVEGARHDLIAACGVDDLVTEEGATLTVNVELAEET